jgi:UDP-glucose:glycoprotein glucosyltransferase
MFPGQLPPLRRDMHNAILPIDFSKPDSAALIVQTLTSLIKRKIPVRWGLVPSAITPKAADQAKVIYHLHKSYGLTAVIQYLQESIAAKQKVLLPHEPVFQKVLEGRSIRENMTALSVPEALADDKLQIRLNKATAYLKRLGAFREQPSLFVNGVPIKHDDDWLQLLSQRVGADLQLIQRGVFEEKYDDDTWIPGVFLENAISSRNPIVIPESDKDVTLVNLQTLLGADPDSVSELPTLPISNLTDPWQSAQLLVIADLNSREGLTLLQNAIKFRENRDNVQVVIAHSGDSIKDKSKSKALFMYITTSPQLDMLVTSIDRLKETDDVALGLAEGLPAFPTAPGLMHSLRLEPGQNALLLNGRKVGPISKEHELGPDDLEMLYTYEDARRAAPTRKALQDLDLTAALSDAPTAAQLFSLVAVAQISDVPDGIFERPPMVRTAIFYDWQDKYTSFSVGSNKTAVINIVVALDPASELAQRWVPILRVLSELSGVSVKVYMNPKNQLDELPVKRFYRYVLNSELAFDEDGAIIGGAATFNSIPAKALLTLGMDVPSVWLVASKESIHDLDNIKLSSLGAGKRVDATYQLESILIEGHSRDVTTDAPPRGIQLVLSTPKDPHLADTLIMANLGYFQFKANPGYYHLDLKSGPSRKIFNLESVGSLGYEAQSGDLNKDVALLSFQGVTLYPRLSRKPGMEEEDVLEPSTDKASELVNQGSKLVGSWLEKAGLGKVVQSASTQADINIFSVASGHLYERMLSIMMVSVMRHTNKTVKFWFIEQFLSPSFKSFVPTLAKEYGFQYEMVTYKWPHWLRAQTEKQREIWGYKILFLDVLFPLDLDKVIFVDADQIVRTDMNELNKVDLQGAPYGFTPMCDSRTEMEGYRFWKQGYWKNHLRGQPYHISALYVVDLKRFRQIAAGDRLRQQYHQLSADPHSLSNLDQDLPNNMQMMIPIHSLDQNWLWCETWCSNESLKDAKTIDLCNNPETKEPKLERAQRQVPEWTEYDNEIAELAKRTKMASRPVGSVQEDELNERKRASSSEEVTSSAEATVSSKKAKPSEKDEL